MYDSDYHILFLGEDTAWSTLSAALVAAPRVALKIHRAQSLNELFLVLAGGQWQAVVLDVHAWNFQGLHYVDKLRSEYPGFPILALHSSSAVGVPDKARNSGASRCLSLEHLSAEGIHNAVLSCLSAKKTQSLLRKTPPPQVGISAPENPLLDPAKTQVISHALSNLLCVITANADMLDEHINHSGPGVHSLAEIKKAAKSAADLMRLLK